LIKADPTGLLQIISPDGTLVGELPDVDLKQLYEAMLRIRIMDERLLALQRQGRLGFYGEARGQEAAVVGSAAALSDGDWIVPALREAGVGLYRGLPLRQYVAQLFGNANDHSKGRQMPCHPCDRSVNYVVMSSCVSSQVPHAVGIAMAMKIAGDHGKVAIGYMGDGGTSEADFHVALNFAGVFKPPVVLFCQNNQWAISTPGHVQTASETIAIKALAYGVEALRVDGNDVAAVYAATRWACDRARAGDGPTFIEALTYRVSAHSSSDDPSRYRDESVTLEWRNQRDPIARLKKYLKIDDTALAARIEEEVREAIAAEEGVPVPPVASIIEDVYEHVPWHLREELEKHHG
jgi:pyruvate dehydrogenase E1 component alpha subunit/2-oxoisovalerate dehydrogenase E1 component alpha subunit